MMAGGGGYIARISELTNHIPQLLTNIPIKMSLEKYRQGNRECNRG